MQFDTQAAWPRVIVEKALRSSERDFSIGNAASTGCGLFPADMVSNVCGTFSLAHTHVRPLVEVSPSDDVSEGKQS